jgi:hypothetical protein
MSRPPTQALGVGDFAAKALEAITPGMSLETPKIGKDVTEISAKHYKSDSQPLDTREQNTHCKFIDSTERCMKGEGGISARISTLKHGVQRKIGGDLEHCKSLATADWIGSEVAGLQLPLLRWHVDCSAARGNSLGGVPAIESGRTSRQGRGEMGIAK